MLEFNYDFLDIYVDCVDYILLEMDIDFNYLCLSVENMYEVIKLNMCDRYEYYLCGYCCDDVCFFFLLWECCKKYKIFDRCVFGLFKIEFEGEKMIGFCLKIYVVIKGNECKFSLKGLNKN